MNFMKQNDRELEPELKKTTACYFQFLYKNKTTILSCKRKSNYCFSRGHMAQCHCYNVKFYELTKDNPSYIWKARNKRNIRSASSPINIKGGINDCPKNNGKGKHM